MRRIALLIACCLPTLAQSAPPEPSMQQAMQAQQMMLSLYDLRKSHLGFEETVAAIRASAEKHGWKQGEVVDMQAAMRHAGNKQALPMKVLHLCPVGANERVIKASGGKAPTLPCRATVFTGADGRVNVVHLNLHTIARGMEGDLAKVLGELANEEDALYQGIVD